MMTLETFVKKNREEIYRLIKGLCPKIKQLSDDDLRKWILNEAGLYYWAKRSGVNI